MNIVPRMEALTIDSQRRRRPWLLSPSLQPTSIVNAFDEERAGSEKSSRPSLQCLHHATRQTRWVLVLLSNALTTSKVESNSNKTDVDKKPVVAKRKTVQSNNAAKVKTTPGEVGRAFKAKNQGWRRRVGTPSPQWQALGQLRDFNPCDRTISSHHPKSKAPRFNQKFSVPHDRFTEFP